MHMHDCVVPGFKLYANNGARLKVPCRTCGKIAPDKSALSRRVKVIDNVEIKSTLQAYVLPLKSYFISTWMYNVRNASFFKFNLHSGSEFISVCCVHERYPGRYDLSWLAVGCTQHWRVAYHSLRFAVWMRIARALIYRMLETRLEVILIWAILGKSWVT